MDMTRLYLQLFAEGEAAPTTGTSTGTVDTGATSQAAAVPAPRETRDEFAGVTFGIPPEQAMAQQTAPAAAAQTPTGQDITEDGWREAKAKYKQYYDAETQNAVKSRIKNIKAAEDNLNRLSPVLNQLYVNYGVNPGDIDNLVKAVQGDDSLLANEAMERGVTVSQLRELKQLEHDHQELQRIKQTQQQEQVFQRHIQGLQQQAERLKQTFPSFDLRQELSSNDEFVRLTSPEVGVDVETAYYVTHRKELQPEAMRVGFQKAQTAFAQAQAANASRPTEGAAQGNSAAIDIRSDPSKWSKKERAEVRRRVMAGKEKVYL